MLSHCRDCKNKDLEIESAYNITFYKCNSCGTIN